MKTLLLVVLVACCSSLYAATKIRVACIGNSITQGNMGPSYVSKLQILLGSDYDVENDGISGTTLLKNGDKPYWKYGRLPQVFSFKPDVITIKLGTNDTKPQNWDSKKQFFKQDYLSMIDTLNTLETNPEIYLVFPAPVFTNRFSIRDEPVKEMIVILKEIAEERNLRVIDVYTPLEDCSECFVDGVHPNDAGADSIANVIYTALTATTIGTFKNKSAIAQPVYGLQKEKILPFLPFSATHGTASAVYDLSGRHLKYSGNMFKSKRVVSGLYLLKQ